MRRYPVLGTALVAAALLAPASAAATPSPTELPTDLQTLIVAESHLTLNGYIQTSTVKNAKGRTIGHTVTVGHSSPGQLWLTATKGANTVKALIVGAKLYVTANGLSKIDGGHTWIRGSAPPAPGGGSLVTFAHTTIVDGTVLALVDATAVREVGPATVGGQAVTEFAVTESGGATDDIYVAADGLLVESVETQD